MVTQRGNTLTPAVREERANLFLSGDFEALTATKSLDEQKYDMLTLTYNLLTLLDCCQRTSTSSGILA